MEHADTRAASEQALLDARDQLLGREEELGWFVERFRLPDGATPGLVVISGELGMGKTALLQWAQALAFASGWQTAGSMGPLRHFVSTSWIYVL